MFRSKSFASLIAIMVSSNVFAASQGIFSSDEKKGIVILNNQGSSDATFMWNFLSVPVTETAGVLKKKLTVSTGQIEVLCSQAKTMPSNASCTLKFVKLPGSIFEIIVDKIQGLISASLTSSTAVEARSQLVFTAGFFVSPDKKLSVCPDCGDMNSEVHINWLRD